jgi:hypothetical protein
VTDKALAHDLHDATLTSQLHPDIFTDASSIGQPVDANNIHSGGGDHMKFHRSRFTFLMIVCLMLGALAARAQSDRENRTVKIVNETSKPIYHLYVSNVDEENWGPDQLGVFESIDSNHYELFNMDDGTGHCLFDIKAVLSDGSYAVHRSFNVCTEGSWTVVDN